MRSSTIRLAPLPPQSVFSAEAQPFEQPLYGGCAQDRARGALQEATPFCHGSGWTLLDVTFEEFARGLVGLRWPSASLPRRQRSSPLGDPRVALYRGEAHAEEASSRRLGHPVFDSPDDTPA